MGPGRSHMIRCWREIEKLCYIRAEETERAVTSKRERDPLTHPHRDETRTAYILQAVECAWEGVDRRKAIDAKDPPVAEDLNGIMVTAEPVSGPSSHPENSEEEEVCVWSGTFSLLQPLSAL